MPTASSHSIGFGDVLWREAAAASAFSHAAGAGLAVGHYAADPIDADAAGRRFQAAPEAGQDRGIGVVGGFGCCRPSSSPLLVRSLSVP